jgi:signal transduction histidine kinase
MADESLLSYALHNLLLNATKYSPQGSKIWINLGIQNGEVLLQIRDEGIGISAKDQERIFEPFYRGSNINEAGGMGLGLSIVKRVVELHQGSIKVVSELGQGTTFVLSFPLSS